MQNPKPLVIVLLGPTASGKTDLAIQIAKKIKVSIHNIDSRQLYKGMNIGTAKPTIEQQEEIKHYLLDLKDPNNPITLHEFKKEAELSLKNIFSKEKCGFLVGGSGLYLKSLTSGLCPPSVPAQEKLRKEFRRLGQKECHQILKKCDPIAWEKISPRDSIRTIRALEVFYSTGQTISSLKTLKPPDWNLLELGLDPRNLQQRIAKRTKILFQKGLIDETKALIHQYGEDLPLLQTIGYKEACTVIKGEYSITEAIEITTQRTNQFAKKQRTWFRRQHNPKWLNEKNSLEEALSLIQNVIG
ncbi:MULTISPECIES: tRNA (adenosine(37)-N6)-dimethylallyltransferase MiaA [Prochlorococcus]|uniref:tRNA dimethylallyltransferase n=1 Tax=Prochlorococcus marinus (strain SARG / CCMP1375 / SS120) TaxID=167539 RepID=MIAA_PROMA|nr:MULTISPECIES: tRNA (adenosine(37)-N6)-dimethylallyltransferase MiaA [Prochlorococcus]Q7TV89.1 RecName: Full=tRNA dimethylallyltransferase; AltName: Full=Dimethylallyl diphosphate:tRNA dimethylallyltransferase; Short=DMAPP:tRNA dimethylallyltransferase; Short=DMATase; AltName: Full=Isopentenyl-diphosphate:tRNA isopentenyltransferase; Short=IPP transferase; Short=IPPT; Short=IPTase [Prochlorococcus marinus subsp. marinus str. CCMP1375]AAQ00841.1 tRNA delta(2)-isopentenylpyrophosphate transferase